MATRVFLYGGLLILGIRYAKILLQSVTIFLSICLAKDLIYQYLGKPANTLGAIGHFVSPVIHPVFSFFTPYGIAFLLIGIFFKLFYWGVKFASEHQIFIISRNRR